jgi:tetratricopeptide (TPR) repeat protein
LAVLNLVQKHYKEADEAFRKAYAVDPSNLRGLLGLAEIQFQQNQPDKAVQLIADEAQKQPQRTDLKKELANSEVRGQRFDKAIEDYRSILDRYKDTPIDQADIYARIAQVYALKGDPEKGIENMQKARQLVPTNIAYATSLGQFLDAAGKRPEALVVYREAMKIDPTNAIVLNNLAYLLTQTNGNLDEALTLAQRAKQQLPNFGEVSDTIGWIYIKKNLSDSAVEIFRDLNNKVKDNSTFHYHYAIALAQKGDKAKALAELRVALQNKPKKAEEDQIKEMVQKLS